MADESKSAAAAPGSLLNDPLSINPNDRYAIDQISKSPWRRDDLVVVQGLKELGPAARNSNTVEDLAWKMYNHYTQRSLGKNFTFKLNLSPTVQTLSDQLLLLLGKKK